MVEESSSSSVYVDVFSNASLEDYPNNTVASFKVKLSTPLSLTGGNYECALAHLICPNTTEPRRISGQILLKTRPNDPNQRHGATRAYSTPPFDSSSSSSHSNVLELLPTVRHYGREFKPGGGGGGGHVVMAEYVFSYNIRADDAVVTNFVEFLNSLFSTDKAKDKNASFADIVTSRILTTTKKKEERYIISITFQNNTLSIFLRDSNLTLAFSSDLAQLLGFNVVPNQWIVFNGAGNYIFHDHSIDVNAVRPSLLSIYSNVILPHFVGDTRAPLIRVVTLPKTRQGPIGHLNFTFQNLHYLPVATKFIQEIEITARGNDGQLIPFQAGLMYLRLHFRLQQQ